MTFSEYKILDKSMQNELEEMFFSEDLLSTMGFVKRELEEDLDCLQVNKNIVYSLGRNIYFFEGTAYGYRFKYGINLE